MIRDEQPFDIGSIAMLTTEAFSTMPYSSGTEAAIIAALRAAGALAISLVAEEAGAIIGHVAFSAIALDGKPSQLFALGPIAVRPDVQRRGFGSKLVVAGLERVKALGGTGVVLVGDPAYYGRFGFKRAEGLVHDGVPAEYVLAHSLRSDLPEGRIGFHPAFFVKP